MVEHHYAFFKRMFRFGHVMVTTPKSESEDIFHSNVLQSCKGKISWPDSVSYRNYWKIREENIEKHTMFNNYSGKIDWRHELRERYRVKVKVLGKPLSTNNQCNILTYSTYYPHNARQTNSSNKDLIQGLIIEDEFA